MDRSAIFIDAGYLLAAGGRLTCGTTSRAAFRCDYAGLATKLEGWVDAHNRGQLSCLRTYWYDGAANAVPTADHEQIGGLPYVKVRLGRLIRGEQKGVDALIYRDLMTLARERAITCAYLLSGDEDLREGVVAAQDMGVQVVLIGIPASGANQSAALIREADEHIVLPIDHWEEHFSRRTVDPAAGKATPTPAAAQTAGRAFGITWANNASPEDLVELAGAHPRVPQDLDVALLLEAERTVGPLHDRQDLKRELRAAFWGEIRAAKDALVVPGSMAAVS
ncbi:MAG TPA: NYN domain-containing protein [Solirubrobacterales bacterium]|nr:NYN domain-containing protein [Solirubrobacterales bacterium]